MTDQNEIIDLTNRMTPEQVQTYPKVRFLVYDDFPPDGMLVGDLGGRMFVGECGTRSEAMLIPVTSNRVILRHAENEDGSFEVMDVTPSRPATIQLQNGPWHEIGMFHPDFPEATLVKREVFDKPLTHTADPRTDRQKLIDLLTELGVGHTVEDEGSVVECVSGYPKITGPSGMVEFRFMHDGRFTGMRIEE